MKMISEVKLLALLIEAYNAGYNSGVQDGVTADSLPLGEINKLRVNDEPYRFEICSALVERANVQ